MSRLCVPSRSQPSPPSKADETEEKPGKTRRVRCDGIKPACGACVKLAAKSKDGEGCECVYRADLWVAQQLQGRERRASTEEEVEVKLEEEEERALPFFFPSLLTELTKSNGLQVLSQQKR